MKKRVLVQSNARRIWFMSNKKHTEEKQSTMFTDTSNKPASQPSQKKNSRYDY